MPFSSKFFTCLRLPDCNFALLTVGKQPKFRDSATGDQDPEDAGCDWVSGECPFERTLRRMTKS